MAILRSIFYRLFDTPLIRRIIKNSGYLFSATGINTGLSMVQSIIVARLLGVAGFGMLGTITMFTSVVNKFASFRMSELVVIYVGKFTEKGDQRRAAAIFKSAAFVEMLASILAFGLAWLLSPLGAKYLLKDITTQGWFQLYAIVLLAKLIAESSTGLLLIFDRFRRIAVVNIAQSVISLIIVAFVYMFHGGFLGVLIAYLVSKAASAMILTTVALYEATRRWGTGWWNVPVNLLRPLTGELVKFAINTNISGSLSLINKDSELLWISFLRNPVETGYYKLALSLASVIQVVISPLPQATYPELSREVARDNYANVRYILRQGSFIAGGYTVMVMIGLFLFGPWLIQYLYTPEYLPAYPAIMILVVGLLFANTFYWNRIALLAIGRPDFPAKINFVVAILKVTGILLLVPIYGYLANAALMAASYIFGVSVSVIAFRLDLVKREQLASA
jgi:O-antigen/teichoic acid export membrane protein